MKTSKNTFLSKDDALHIAQLANLVLKDKEIEKLTDQLSETIKHVNQLKEINTTHVEPTNHVTNLENVTREDKITPSLSQEEALSNAKNTYKGFFKVKAVFGET